MNVADLRKDYRSGELRRANLSSSPFSQFEKWFAEALTCPGVLEANAMTLATAGTDGRVMARTVLLKAWDEQGLVFFTNYESTKARHLRENPQASLLFTWLALERQVSFCGRVEKVSREESAAYFASRPVSSQLGAWVSTQSAPISGREELEKKLAAKQAEFLDKKIPLPDYWGGYRLVPETVEFWQGRTDRLHDRFLYKKENDQKWEIERLSP